MTDIKIPASIDQQAAQRLEEYGCWNEWNEAGSLVGFIVLTIREATGLEVELKVVDKEDTILGKAAHVGDIRVWPTYPSRSDWYWNVQVQRYERQPPRYWVYARRTYSGNSYADLGNLTRVSAVLAVVCSGLTFKLPPLVDTAVIAEYRHGAHLVTDISIRALRECASKAYADGSCHGLSKDIANTFTYLGFGVHVEDGEFYHIEISKGGVVTYVLIPVSDKDYGMYYKTATTYLYLGTVDSIAAVVAIVCGGVTFYDDASDKVAPLSKEDAEVLEHLIEETTPPFISLNAEDSQALVDALQNPPPPNEALLEAAGHYKATVTSEPPLEDAPPKVYKQPTSRCSNLRGLYKQGDTPTPPKDSHQIHLPSGTTLNPAFIEAVEYRIAAPSYDGGYYLTLDDRDNRYCWSPTKVCLVVWFNSGHSSLYGGEDANAVWYHYHGEILYVDTRERYVVLETPGIKVKVRPGPTYDWVSRAVVEDIELAIAKLLVEHRYVNPKVLEDVQEGAAMLRFMRGRPIDPSSGGLYVVRKGWDSPEPELLMACTQQD